MAFSSEVGSASREENASNQKQRITLQRQVQRMGREYSEQADNNACEREQT
jgi:hypothetical protein